MSFRYNVFTGNLDLVGGSTGGPVAAEDVSYDNSISGLTANNVQDAIDELSAISGANYNQSFNATTDWTLDGSIYKIDVVEGTHLKGISPQVQVFELVLTNHVLINTDVVIDNTGKVSVQVNQNPDLRFAGKIVIS